MLESHIAERPATTEEAGLPGCLGAPVGAGGPVDSVGHVAEAERVQPPAECSVGLISGAGEFDAAGNMFLQEGLVNSKSLVSRAGVGIALSMDQARGIFSPSHAEEERDNPPPVTIPAPRVVYPASPANHPPVMM